MNRMERIKERLDTLYYANAATSSADIEFLLERLEIAEKALELMSTGNFSVPMEYSQIEAYQKYAESALNRIRE